MDFSREFGIAPNIIEKDYMLGWLLAGISQHAELSNNWIFKGGTCLKKCYSETYRFSEDLDFTLTQPEHQNKDFLINIFKEIATWIYDATGIEVPREMIRFDIYKNPGERISVEGRIYYKGPLGFSGAPPRIKLDLTAKEAFVLDQVNREVHHPYSDKPEGGIHIQCYCLEEVFAEKIRALAERLRPRDLYDVIHLYRRNIASQDRKLIFSTLKKKCEFKEIPVPTMKILESKPERAELVSEWENMLGHQVPVLPPFEQYWHELPEVFEWLYRAVEKIAPAAMPVMMQEIDVSWHPPAMAQAWHTTIPIEILRYAASARLCINLTYKASERMIEPYSLRRTSEGNLLLYAVKHDTGELRSYRVDRIQNATVTQIPFQPRYAVELTAASPLSIPPTAIRTGRISRKRLQQIKSIVRRPKGYKPDYGPKYIFECSYCGKRFSHKSYDVKLNNHKDKHGYPCPGRIGSYVDTKY
jgi:predicted nucleotidyltransferase component of viral defense system